MNIWRIQLGGTGGMPLTSPLIPTLLANNLAAKGFTNLNELGLNATARRMSEFGNRGSDVDRRTFRVAKATSTWDSTTD